MKYRRLTCIAVVACFFGLSAGTDKPQTGTKSGQNMKAVEEYYRVLDTIFPLPNETPNWGKIMLALRFIRPSKTESQINIVESNDGEFSVTEFYVPPSEKSIQEQLLILYFDSRLNHSDDPGELAKQFKFDRRSVKVPKASLIRILDELDHLPFPSMKVAPQMMEADPNAYELWYKAFNLGELKYRFAYHSDRKENAKVLGDWMDRVRKAVDSVH